jgi:hypothetical protein
MAPLESISNQPRPMKIIGTILLYAGVISLILGYVGIVFCGFADGIGRGLRNLILPIFGFGDAMRRFHFLIWLWGGGIAGVVLGSLLV